ncbi:MAG: hypothetical protein IJ424_03810 [Oscillospiraceae bacterium]|nr:hypothetical protein [Oscillospiraceae bacterium]
MEILKIVGICIICAILSKVISQNNKELAVITSISAVAICAMLIIGSISDVISQLNGIFNSVGIEKGYISSAFKALGICCICELTASSCRDSGESALAGVIDISGKVSVSLLCLPLLDKLMDVVKSILEM